MGAHINSKRNCLTIREWLTFRIQSRDQEAQTLLRSRRLFQQFRVDGYNMMESDKLDFIRKNQSTLRVDKFSNLTLVMTYKDQAWEKELCCHHPLLEVKGTWINYTLMVC